MKEYSSNECKDVVDGLRSVFHTGKTKSYEFRLHNLKQLRKLLVEKEGEMIDALNKDLGRCDFEGIILDILPALAELDFIIKNLKSWMQPEYTSNVILAVPSSSKIVYEPYGVALIIAPFNYPLQLAISPLVGAIAAGNCAVIKPSEISQQSELFLAKYLPHYIDSNCFKVICGGVETTQSLLAQEWDKIFFTGSTRVGKIVMKAAAEFLTPVSLELGGKSPTIIDETTGDLEVVVKRILWGKFINAGQTCIAPDYILCHEKKYEDFLKMAKEQIVKFFGENPQDSINFSRIVTCAHAQRLQTLLADEKDRIVVGGKVDVSTRYVAPTIVKDVNVNSKLMSDEIFGPILPVIKFHSITEVPGLARKICSKPLALYVFSHNRKNVDFIINNITAGGVTINDTIMHIVNFHLPFGGVGPSGHGGYHGKFSFECFSHRKSIVDRNDTKILDIPVRYPPYTKGGLKLFRFAMGLPSIPTNTQLLSTIVTAALVIGAAIAVAVILK